MVKRCSHPKTTRIGWEHPSRHRQKSWIKPKKTLLFNTQILSTWHKLVKNLTSAFAPPLTRHLDIFSDVTTHLQLTPGSQARVIHWERKTHNNSQKTVEICWNMLKYVEICWNMLKYDEICWNMMKYVGTRTKNHIQTPDLDPCHPFILSLFKMIRSPKKMGTACLRFSSSGCSDARPTTDALVIRSWWISVSVTHPRTHTEILPLWLLGSKDLRLFLSFLTCSTCFFFWIPTGHQSWLLTFWAHHWPRIRPPRRWETLAFAFAHAWRLGSFKWRMGSVNANSEVTDMS